MKSFLLLSFAWLFVSLSSAEDELTCYEMRIYHATPGKLDELHARFRDHTVDLFAKHGMTNLIYWTPVENDDGLLIYLLAYPDKPSRDASWKAFLDDPDWKAAYKASTQDGKLVAKIESTFLDLTDYSPLAQFPETKEALFYEMREYTAAEGMLPKLDARFRDHTVGLFTKHGVTNLPYFHVAEGQEGEDNILLYFISADSEEARDASFKAFSEDPAWKKARDESQKDGRLLVPKGVKSTYLKTTDYSPIK